MWGVQCSCGVCSAHVGCAVLMWGVQCSCGVCSAHVGCAVLMWGVQCSCGVCSAHVGCAVLMWGVQCSCGVCMWGAILCFVVLYNLVLLPDLTGSSDGSVLMWEFGTTNPVSVQKSPQGAGVVTKIRFTPQGNKVSILPSMSIIIQICTCTTK